VIIVTRLNGPAFAVNPDLVERAEATPDTILTLIDGTKYVIAEALPTFVARVRDYRASVVARSFDPNLITDLVAAYDEPHAPSTRLSVLTGEGAAPQVEGIAVAPSETDGFDGNVVPMNRREV
jgi:flagellar protein FlbD